MNYLDSAVSARDQMRFQERMSNSAHVREVADLQAAGLNPVLSAGGSGASTPTGSSDLAEILNATRSYGGSAKAVEDATGDGVQNIFGGILTAMGLGRVARGMDKMNKGVKQIIESNPDVFDDKWKHHNPNAQYNKKEVWDKEKAYREGKNQQLKNSIYEFFKKLFSPTYSSAKDVDINAFGAK